MISGSVIVGLIDNGEWSACFGLSYRDLMLYDLGSNQRFYKAGAGEMRKVTGTMGVASARNQIAADFLDKTEGEWLFFIDTDMGFGPDTVDRLVASADAENRPVVGGLCFAMRRTSAGDFYAERYGIQPTVYEYLEIEDEVGFRPILDYKRDEVIPVAGTGAACLLIHRSLLEKIRERFGDKWFEPITHPTGDKGKPRTFSEDLSFCVRCQSIDIPVHVDTSVRTTHEKGALYLDETTFDMQRYSTEA
ncbi:glycosyltransferase family A protein [Microbispora bryophytorum]|uniref:glycosyltransferase family A protein n=1 Tax=Microbispora bryophytorum TaxID=1460882 RepID=UPI0033FCEB2C